MGEQSSSRSWCVQALVGLVFLATSNSDDVAATSLSLASASARSTSRWASANRAIFPATLASTNPPQRARVVLITAVFGKCPLYVPFFLKTAAFSGVDVLLVGDVDDVVFPQLPSNVRQIHMTWDDLVDRVSERVFDGKPVPELRTAKRYKVVDLKPTYGILFQEYVTSYEFW